MEEKNEFGFCPKCGAVMQNGVCQSCGYGRRMDTWQPKVEVVSPPRSGKSVRGKVIAGVFISIGILCLAAIVIFMYFSIRTAFQRVMNDTPNYGSEYGNGYFGYGNPYESYPYDDDYSSGNDSGYYEPDKNDEYYEEITDATSQDLDYHVIWKSTSMRPDDSDDTCTYDCVYPVLTGEDEGKFSSMSDTIRNLICKYQDTYKDYESGVSSSGYVTYMDEEKISVVVKHSFYEKKSTIPRVEAVTLNIKTGEVISHENLVEIDDDLVWQFRARNTSQNGTVEFVDNLSDEELAEYLKDEENSVMFYTPVGLEIGFNYDGGWVTVTLKTDTL